MNENDKTQEMIKDLYQKYKCLQNDFEIYKKSNSNDLLSMSKTLISITQKLNSFQNNKENNLDFPKSTRKHILDPIKYEDKEYFPKTAFLRTILDQQKEKIHEEHLQKMQKEKDERRIEKQRQTLLKKKF